MFSKKAIKASAFELLTLTRVNLGLSKDFLSAVNLANWRGSTGSL